MRAPAAGALLLAFALAACRTDSPERVLYQWSDAAGNVRYTTEPSLVPRASRATLARVVPGQSAVQNAALFPGASTEPRPETSGRDWLRGEETDAGLAASAAEVKEQASVPTTPEEIAALDARIRALEQQITEAEVTFAQRIGEPDPSGNPVDEAAVRQAADQLPRLQAELAELRARRELVAPGNGP